MPAHRSGRGALTTADGCLKVNFRRIGALGYESVAVRPDGVVVRVSGAGSLKLKIPHDLAHLVCERELRLTRGFWGSVAAGALWQGMEILGGRRPPHFRERSAAVIRANTAELSLAEVLSGRLQFAVRRDLDVRTTVSLLHEGWSGLRTGSPPFQDGLIAQAHSVLRDYSAQWAELGIGGTLNVEWVLGRSLSGRVIRPGRA